MKNALLLLLALILLGCTSFTQVGVAPVITGPTNVSIVNNGEAQFQILSGAKTSTYTIKANAVERKAAEFTVGNSSFIVTVGGMKTVNLEDVTLFVTLADIQGSTAIVTLSTAPLNVTKKANGVSCTANSQCQSNYCNSNFCCNSGTCCVISNDCPSGQRCLSNTCVSPEVQLCSDGTPYGNCSSNKPKYCSSGNLVDSCLVCGCLEGDECNSTSNTCFTPPTQPLYTPQDAEAMANSTTYASLVLRFGILSQSASGCAGAANADIACLPALGVSTTQTGEGAYEIVYSYVFAPGCCSVQRVLTVDVDLVSHSISQQWVPPYTLDESSLNSMNSSLSNNCATAVGYLTCRAS